VACGSCPSGCGIGAASKTFGIMFSTGRIFFCPHLLGRVLLPFMICQFQISGDASERAAKAFELEFQRSLKRASHLIAVSKAVRDEIVKEFSWPAERITAIAHGVSELFAPRTYSDLVGALNRVGLRPDEYVLCVSTIEPRKGIDRLLEAYAGIAPESRRRYPLVIVGHGGWLSEIIHQPWTEHSARMVAVFGVCRRGGTSNHLCRCASIRISVDLRGVGLPVLEAMASGVPVLTSNCSSLSEVSGGAAVLVEPLDVDALRLGIEQVIRDETWRWRPANVVCRWRRSTRGTSVSIAPWRCIRKLID